MRPIWRRLRCRDGPHRVRVTAILNYVLIRGDHPGPFFVLETATPITKPRGSTSGNPGGSGRAAAQLRGILVAVGVPRLNFGESWWQWACRGSTSGNPGGSGRAAAQLRGILAAVGVPWLNFVNPGGSGRVTGPVCGPQFPQWHGHDSSSGGNRRFDHPGFGSLAQHSYIRTPKSQLAAMSRTLVGTRNPVTTRPQPNRC